MCDNLAGKFERNLKLEKKLFSRLCAFPFPLLARSLARSPCHLPKWSRFMVVCMKCHEPTSLRQPARRAQHCGPRIHRRVAATERGQPCQNDKNSQHEPNLETRSIKGTTIALSGRKKNSLHLCHTNPVHNSITLAQSGRSAARLAR
jgi:hypothetical protein